MQDGESVIARDGTLSIRHDVIDDVTDNPVSDVLPATMPSSVAMTATAGGSPELQSLTKVHSNLRQFLDASQAEHSAMNAIVSLCARTTQYTTKEFHNQWLAMATHKDACFPTLLRPLESVTS